MQEFLKLRKKVFIDEMGWDIASDGSLEYDLFDSKDSIYTLIYINGVISMCARGQRVIPEIQNHTLIQTLISLFPEISVPLTPCDWDVTRLCANKNCRTSKFKKCIGFWVLFLSQRLEATKQNCDRLVAATSPDIVPAFKKIGIHTIKLSDSGFAEDCGEFSIFYFRT